jgi:hypothetical protein
VRRTRIVQSIVLAAALPALFLADLSADRPFGLGFVREAGAVVGAPLTPMSVAGVARRTTRRVVVAEAAATQSATAATTQQQQATAQQQAATGQQQAAVAQKQAATAQAQAAAAPAGAAVGTVVTTLPAGCVQETKAGVAYQKCGGVYYRPGFQGDSLVYVVQQP